MHQSLENRPYSLRELEGLKLPPVPYIIQGMTPEHSKTLTTAAAKSYKTFFALQRQFSIVTGLPLLDMAVAKPTPALYVNLEVYYQHIVERVIAMAVKNIDPEHMAALQDKFHVWTPDKAIDLMNIGCIGLLKNRIKTCADLHGVPIHVTLDPLYKLHHFDENSPQMKEVAFKLDEVVTMPEVLALNVIHHQGKNSDGLLSGPAMGRGHSSMAMDWPDVIETFSRTDTTRVLNITGRLPEQQFKMVWDKNLMWWKLSDGQAQDNEKSLEKFTDAHAGQKFSHNDLKRAIMGETNWSDGKVKDLIVRKLSTLWTKDEQGVYTVKEEAKS